MTRRFTGDPSGAGLGFFPPGSLQNMPNLPQRIRSGRFRPFGTAADCAQTVFDEHRYATIGGSVEFPVGNASQLVLPQAAGSLRNFLGFRNNSANDIFVEFGNNASTASWLRIVQNQIVLFDTVVQQDDVYAVCPSGNGLLVIAFSTYPGQRC